MIHLRTEARPARRVLRLSAPLSHCCPDLNQPTAGPLLIGSDITGGGDYLVTIAACRLIGIALR